MEFTILVFSGTLPAVFLVVLGLLTKKFRSDCRRDRLPPPIIPVVVEEAVDGSHPTTYCLS